MNQLVEGVGRFIKDDEGVTMIEYGLLAALIAVACIVAIGFIATGLNTTFKNVAACLGATSGGTCPK